MKKTALSALASLAVQLLRSSDRFFATPIHGLVFASAPAPYFLRR